MVLADLRLPDGDGIILLKELRKQGHNNPYIVMTDYDEVPTAVRSMKSGAEDYIPKKLLPDNLLPLLRTLQKRRERYSTAIYERQSAAFKEITAASGWWHPRTWVYSYWVKTVRARNTSPRRYM